MHTLKIQLTTKELADAFTATYGETAKDEWSEVKKLAETLSYEDILETVLDIIRDYGVDKTSDFVRSDGTETIAHAVTGIFMQRFD